MMKLYKFAACVFLLLGAEAAKASVIGFEDLGNRSQTFNAMGVSHSYQGFDWGYGMSGGVADRRFDDLHAMWYLVTASNPAGGIPPNGIEGTSFAFNWGNPQSLWVDFRTSTDVTSVNVGRGYTPAWATYQNASSIQLFGYDANDHLIGQTEVTPLGDSLQPLLANFSGVRYLEIRANAARSFTVDNLVVAPAAVPVPGAFWLLGSALAGLGWLNKRKQA